MRPSKRQSAGFSLVELLIVVSLIGILAATIIPNSNPSVHDQLHAAAALLSADVGYARNLAVANASSYKLTFDLVQNEYILRHSGANAALNQLPPSPFRKPGDALDKLVTNFSSLPNSGAKVQLLAAHELATAHVDVEEIEFGPLGETSCTGETQVWLAAGSGTARRFLSVRVNPVTGLCWTEGYRADSPTAVAAGS